MAKKKNQGRQNITVECTEARELGLTPSRYTTTKNKKNTPKRIELRKYNRFLGRVTVHKEIK
jgi:large subunit ribosomal protein L33